MRGCGAPVARAGWALSDDVEQHLTNDVLALLSIERSEIVSDAARDLLRTRAERSNGMSLPRLKAAIEAGWDRRTAYLGAYSAGNPALGQCYPTARVVQWFFPELDIASGTVDTGSAVECHFWNVDQNSDPATHIDLTWRQFPAGSTTRSFRILDRTALGDSLATIARCQLLLHRVLVGLARQHGHP